MNILVTGSNGFIGKNLIAELRNRGCGEVYEYDIDSDESLLEQYCKNADFVFNLAGINRPQDVREFTEGNRDFISVLISALKKHGNACPILMSSSTQAELDNPYGQSKKAGEDLLFIYSRETGADVFVYRLPNVFGKWGRPNYNSAVATFCHNIAHDLPIVVNNPETVLNLVYIDDVVEAFISAMSGRANRSDDGFCRVQTTHTVKLGEVARLVQSFKDSRKTLDIPNMSDAFVKKLYATYLSYLPENGFNYPLKMNCDERGSFTEILRTVDRGQFSVNITKPGITKGNHWHHTKNEKFVVVSGEGVIRFRKITGGEVIEYKVSGDNIEVVDIPPGYTHNIENIGDTDLITFMWCNECFDPERPDTHFMEV